MSELRGLEIHEFRIPAKAPAARRLIEQGFGAQYTILVIRSPLKSSIGNYLGPYVRPVKLPQVHQRTMLWGGCRALFGSSVRSFGVHALGRELHSLYCSWKLKYGDFFFWFFFLLLL